MQYLTGQLVVNYRTINRFRVAKYNKRTTQNEKARIPLLEISSFFVVEKYFVPDSPEPRNLKAKLFSSVIIRTKHIHSNHLDATSHLSGIA